MFNCVGENHILHWILNWLNNYWLFNADKALITTLHVFKNAFKQLHFKLICFFYKTTYFYFLRRGASLHETDKSPQTGQVTNP